MRVVGGRSGSEVKLPDAGGRIIGLASREFGLVGHICANAASSATGPWSSANDPLAIPFTLFSDARVYRLGWINGSAAGDNIDVGIYTPAWVRKVSTGSVACTGNSVMQWATVTTTLLPAGRYFLAMARDTTTANRQGVFSMAADARLLSFAGCYDSTTDAFPLPDPLTNMVAAVTQTRFPYLFIQTRA